MKETFARIKETILYYIVSIYMQTWLYNKVFFRIYILKGELVRCLNKEEAERLCMQKRYKYIPKSVKKKLIDEKFG